MKVRLALGTALAFGLALVAGRVLFNTAEDQKAATPVVASVPTAAPAPAKKRSPIIATTTGASGAPDSQIISRDLKSVEGGVKNENARMTHFISNVYTEGVLHAAPGHKNATLQWRPTQKEVRSGNEIVSVIDKSTPVRGNVEADGEAPRMYFTNTYKNTNERMFIRNDGGMEHDILLSAVPAELDYAQNLAYSGRLHLSNGISIYHGKNKITEPYKTTEGLSFKNENGNTVFFLRPGFAWDAEVTKPDGSLDKVKQGETEHNRRVVKVEYQIDFDESGPTLAIVTPGKWLKDPQRAYPVTIDPLFGPFNLADDTPPTYVGVLGTDTLLPAYNATAVITAATAGVCNRSLDDRSGSIIMPFAFTFYGTTYPAGTPFFVYENGYANFQAPIPCQSIFYPLGGCNDELNSPLARDLSTAGPCTAAPGLKDFTFYPYWDDLVITGTQDSGVYAFVDGDAFTGNRRLVIEWHKMSFKGGDSSERISFNLILYECESRFQFIIGQPGETDRRSSTVGFLGTLNPLTGGGYVQYEYKDGTVGAGSDPNDIIPLGTTLTFQRSRLANLVVVPVGATQGCIPFTVCFQATVTSPPRAACVESQPLPPTLGYVWNFDDNTFIFTGPDAPVTPGASNTGQICHTYTTQDITQQLGQSISQIRKGQFNVTVTITDEFGATSVVGPFLIQVCDPPDIIIGGTPQGGLAPLDVNFFANAIGTPETTYNLTTTPPVWTITQLNQTDLAQAGTVIATVSDANAVGTGISRISYRFNTPGIYRVSVLYQGQDTLANLPAPGTGVIYIFVASQTDLVPDAMIITESSIKFNWVDKQDGPDADGLPPNNNSIVPGQGLPDRPFTDTLTMKGYLNLPGVTLSSLAGKPISVRLNGVNIVFSGILNADGTAIDGDASTGKTGTFKLDLPSGAFSLVMRDDLALRYGVAQTDSGKRLFPVAYRIDIPTVFPPPAFDNAIITYDYQAVPFQAGPPPKGLALGTYKFGAYTNDKIVTLGTTDGIINTAPEFGKPGGQTLLVSGAFIVTDAKLKLKGNMVYADIGGYLSRFGGDDLQPRDDSDVFVAINGFREALNFTTTGGFKAKGKAPSQLFTFKRPKQLGKTGVASLQWKNRAGLFRIKTNGIPNEQVGLNTAAANQILNLQLQITPEATQEYLGYSRFEVFKQSATSFVRNKQSKK